MIHLDTSFLIRALARGAPEDRMLRRWLHDGESLAMSAVGWAEFRCGPLPARDAELAVHLLQVMPFTGDDATAAAALFNASGRRRGSLVDCMVAAAALQARAPLATANVADFRRFEASGLEVLTAEAAQK